ncbi:hypothetical protein HDV05_003724 [Chytridiales sp. JEL 0842]|nr:hypothetical protein HDV05_003724 [Chytridiales sp. JEL 0842]
MEFTVVDAFTKDAYSGNPAAVIIFPEEEYTNGYPADQHLLKIAAEFNLSETAFLLRDRTSVYSSVHPTYHLRWFTPAVEVDLCGHATLASAYVLYTKVFGKTEPKTSMVQFTTRSGMLTASLVRQDDVGPVLALDFPARPLKPIGSEAVSDVLKVRPDQILYVGKADTGDILVELIPELDVEAMFVSISEVAKMDARCVIVTSQPVPRQIETNSKLDFISRVFCPNCGVNEDPVTGSAHTALAYHYASKLNKYKGSGAGETLYARQVSKRGGDLEIVLDKSTNRVELRGYAVAVSEGRLLKLPWGSLESYFGEEVSK